MNETVAKLIKEVRERLEDLSPYLFGEEERPDDLYDCGYTDAEFNTLVWILDTLGEEHTYEYQEG